MLVAMERHRYWIDVNFLIENGLKSNFSSFHSSRFIFFSFAKAFVHFFIIVTQIIMLIRYVKAGSARQQELGPNGGSRMTSGIYSRKLTGRVVDSIQTGR